MNNFKKIMIIVWSFIIVALIVILALCIKASKPVSPIIYTKGFNVNSFFDFNSNEDNDDDSLNNQTFEFNINEVKSIDASLIIGNVTIKEGSGDSVKIQTLSDDSNKVYVENKDGEITIEQKGKVAFKWFNFESYSSRSEVVIELPKSYKNQLYIKTVSGDITSDMDLTLNDCSISTTSGSIKMGDVTADSISMISISGDIEVEKLTGDIKASVTSGDIEIGSIDGQLEGNSVSGRIKADFSNITGKISVNTVSGDIDFKIPETCGVNINYSTTSGDLRSEYPSAFEGKHSSDITIGDGKYNCKINTISGDVKISK